MRDSEIAPSASSASSTLYGCPSAAKAGARIVARDLFARPLAAFGDLAADLVLDRFEVVVRDRLGTRSRSRSRRDRWADRDLHARMKPHHRFREQVCRRVAEHEERVRIVRVARRQELDVLPVGERKAQIARLSVDSSENRLSASLGPIARAASSPDARREARARTSREDDLHGALRIDGGAGFVHSAVRGVVSSTHPLRKDPEAAASRRWQGAPYTQSDEHPAAEAPGTVERLARRPLEHLGGVVQGVARALPRANEDMFADRCTQYAAAIAYRVLFSLFP